FSHPIEGGLPWSNMLIGAIGGSGVRPVGTGSGSRAKPAGMPRWPAGRSGVTPSYGMWSGRTGPLGRVGLGAGAEPPAVLQPAATSVAAVPAARNDRGLISAAPLTSRQSTDPRTVRPSGEAVAVEFRVAVLSLAELGRTEITLAE